MRFALSGVSSLLPIEGGGSVFLGKDSIHWESSNEPQVSERMLKDLKSRAYEYEKTEGLDLSLSRFEEAKENWLAAIKRNDIEIETNISFVVHDQFDISDSGEFIQAGEGEIFSLFESNELLPRSVIHIERAALACCIEKGFILKQVMSGSLTIQFREPDRFYPATMFSLAYFGLPRA